MRFLSHSKDKVTIEFSLHELHLASALIQEGRISHECESPNGQALEDGIRSIVIRLEESLKAGLEFGGTH
jgi:hypothetical protein